MKPFEIVGEHFDGEVKVLAPMSYWDHRGYFALSYSESDYEELGIQERFVREMHTYSKAGVLRGLHFQTNPPMGKLIRVIQGRVFAAIVDVRETSPTFLEHVTVVMSQTGYQVWIPSGFALGYYCLDHGTIMSYKCTGYVGDERAIRWDDPGIGIKWPFAADHPILSDRDANAPTSREYWRIH